MSRRVRAGNYGYEEGTSCCTSHLSFFFFFFCETAAGHQIDITFLSGYHENAKATESTVNRDGWLMTGAFLLDSEPSTATLLIQFFSGDVCIRSEDGFYSIVDRTKELIKYKGASSNTFNVNSTTRR